MAERLRKAARRIRDKMIRTRLRQSDTLVASIDKQGPTVAEALGRLFAPFLPEGQQMPDWTLVIQLVTAYVKSLRGKIATLGSLHIHEVDERIDTTDERNVKAREVIDYILKLKDGFNYAFGPSGYKLIGIASRVSFDPYVTAAQAPRILANLRAFTPPQISTPIDVALLADEFEILVNEFLPLVGSQDAEQRGTEHTSISSARPAKILSARLSRRSVLRTG